MGNTIIGDGFSDGDGDCIAGGLPTSNGTSGNAITTDTGHNLDEDGSCGLTGPGDQSNKPANLVPIADNGGPTHTEALLFGSAAIDAANDAACPSPVSTDQRGTARPQGVHCDIGAFEAVRNMPPATAATLAADSPTNDTSATLNATINLAGEAGKFHFIYGTDPTGLSSSSPEAAAGVVSANTPETEQVGGLTPGTTYYYKVVADNASGSLPDPGSPLSSRPRPTRRRSRTST